MDKTFVIEDRKGFVSLPARIGGYSFPLSFGALQDATEFPSKESAQKAIKKYHLENTAHVEEKY